MPKLKRGKNARKIPNWRGTCPLCGRPRVKLLWKKAASGREFDVCKRCASNS